MYHLTKIPPWHRLWLFHSLWIFASVVTFGHKDRQLLAYGMELRDQLTKLSTNATTAASGSDQSIILQLVAGGTRANPGRRRHQRPQEMRILTMCTFKLILVKRRRMQKGVDMEAWHSSTTGHLLSKLTHRRLFYKYYTSDEFRVWWIERNHASVFLLLHPFSEEARIH